MNTRLVYVVMKAFEDQLPFANMDVTYCYSVGDEVRLRPEGRIARKWLGKGYIKQK